MKKYIVYILSFLLILIISSCSPLGRKYDSTTVQSDIVDIKKTGTSDEDVLLLDYYIKSKQLHKEKIPPNVTYEDLLDEAKLKRTKTDVEVMKKKDEEDILSHEKTVKLDSMKQNVAVTLMGKNLTEMDYRQIFTLSLKIQNNSSKNIKALKGTMVFIDVFGDTLKTYELKCTQLIPYYQFIFYSTQQNFDLYSEPDVNLSNIEMNNIKFSFVPEMILYDTSTLAGN